MSSAELHDFIQHRLDNGVLPEQAERVGEELFLAYACAQGDETAFAAFKNRYEGEIRAVLLQMRLEPDTISEVEQHIWVQLFVGNSSRSPQIGQYLGRGSLAGWLQTFTARRALDEIARARPRSTWTRFTEALELGVDDPEIEYFKRKYKHEFQSVLSEAKAALPPGDQHLLERYFLDDLSIDELAVILSIHRATVARRVQRAHRRLLAKTRKLLCTRLGVEKSVVDSILRLLASRLEF